MTDKYKILFKEKNEGKGSALRLGFLLSTGDYIVVQDADLEYDPEEYNHLLRPLINGRVDVVYGSRFVSSKPHRVLYFWHYLGNKFLTFFVFVFRFNYSNIITAGNNTSFAREPFRKFSIIKFGRIFLMFILGVFNLK